MIRALALRVTRHRNYFPDQTGISKYFSASTILSKKVVDCKKELVHSFGDYVQANFDNNPKNNNIARILDCIYLHDVDNLQGGHVLMDLATGQQITRPKITACIMTRMVIDRVEELAIKQGYKSLRFYNQKKQPMVLKNADLLAGVGVWLMWMSNSLTTRM